MTFRFAIALKIAGGGMLSANKLQTHKRLRTPGALFFIARAASLALRCLRQGSPTFPAAAARIVSRMSVWLNASHALACGGSFREQVMRIVRRPSFGLRQLDTIAVYHTFPTSWDLSKNII